MTPITKKKTLIRADVKLTTSWPSGPIGTEKYAVGTHRPFTYVSQAAKIRLVGSLVRVADLRRRALMKKDAASMTSPRSEVLLKVRPFLIVSFQPSDFNLRVRHSDQNRASITNLLWSKILPSSPMRDSLVIFPSRIAHTRLHSATTIGS